MSGLPTGWITAPLGAFTLDCGQRVPEESEEFKYIDIGSVNRDTKRIETPQQLLGKDAPSRARKRVFCQAYPSLNEGALIANAADELGLRYFRSDNGSPIKRSRLTDWLTLAAQWCSGGWQNGSVSLAQLLRSWRLLRRSLTRDAEILAARARLIAALFSNRNGDMSLRTWLLVLRDKVLDDMLNEEPGLSDEKDNLDGLMKAASSGGTLQNFTVEIFGNQGKSPDQINFITLHSSKGLEFEAVIMLGLENGVFPSSYARTQEELEEAARLFYVGITRAKSQIHLMYAHNESPLITSIREAI